MAGHTELTTFISSGIGSSEHCDDWFAEQALWGKRMRWARRVAAQYVRADLADEVVATAIEQLFRYRSTYDVNRAPWKVYAFREIRQSAWKVLKQSPSRTQAADGDDTPMEPVDPNSTEPIETLNAEELGKRLERLVAKRGPLERQVFTDHILGRQSFDELAACVGCQPSSVRSAKTRLLGFLRQVLAV